VCARGDHLPFSNSLFATTMSNSVLEHIPDVDSVLCETHRVMQEGSQLIICVPNDNFTRNLSIARFFDFVRLGGAAAWYRKFFNHVSRHFHPDSHEIWIDRLRKSGFKIAKSWKYFTPASLSILEWGHYLGVPSLINRIIFGRWILLSCPVNPILVLRHIWLSKHVAKDQRVSNGAYSFFISNKQ
jgi:SAM-dependent methyltransferase